ncbi:hypothetical protein [Cupriavidus necator]|uniref:hypothetical protein n=1 Tax=Cupriavidus necator TaxID=106590 RepID=UPI0030F38675
MGSESEKRDTEKGWVYFKIQIRNKSVPYCLPLLQSEQPMINRKLTVLIGRAIKGADLTPQAGGLLFDGEITLNIYNRYSLVGVKGADVQELIGTKVLDVEEANDHVTLILSCSAKIEIDLADDAYSCPEAMQLRVPGEPIVVWN